jgi:5-methylthioribose kinase
MRKLNHEHVFSFPLNSGNGLSLDSITPGLSALARQLQQNVAFCKAVAEAGAAYLNSRAEGCLLHGDYFPGSWLRTEHGVFVIDPEFCFYGPPEWDVGVMLAHLHLAGQPAAMGNRALSMYTAHAPLDRTLLSKFAGVEIMRRLIGVAQLPVAYGLRAKEELLHLARNLVLGC